MRCHYNAVIFLTNIHKRPPPPPPPPSVARLLCAHPFDLWKKFVCACMKPKNYFYYRDFIHWADGRLNVRSHEVSEPGVWLLKWSYRSAISQASRRPTRSPELSRHWEELTYQAIWISQLVIVFYIFLTLRQYSTMLCVWIFFPNISCSTSCALFSVCVCVCVCLVILKLTDWGRDKWPPFSRRHFQMHFLEWKCINFD